jgi:hypothetical protein
MNPISSRKKQFIALLIIIITGLSGKLFAQANYPADVKDRISEVENNPGVGIRIDAKMEFSSDMLVLHQNGQNTEAKKLP